MAVVAKVAPQLNSTACTAQADCGPSSVIAALYLASQGRFMASTGTFIGSAATRGAMVTRIRKAGGIPTKCSGTGYPVGATVTDLATAFTKIASQDFAGLGVKTITARKLTATGYSANGPNGFDNYLKPKLVSGMHAHVAVRYTAIDEYNDQAVSGQCGFANVHSILVTNYRLVGAVPWVTIVDPLADGRASASCGGRHVAIGPQQIPLSVLKTAMGDGLSTGTGGAQAYLFSTAGLIVDTTNDPPVAVATADVVTGQVPFTVHFNAGASTDPNGDALTYAWDLDDDGAYDDSTSATPTKLFTVAGEYRVRVKVTDSHGAFDTDSFLITALDTPPAEVDPFPYDPCAAEGTPE